MTQVAAAGLMWVGLPPGRLAAAVLGWAEGWLLAAQWPRAARRWRVPLLAEVGRAAALRRALRRM